MNSKASVYETVRIHDCVADKLIIHGVRPRGVSRFTGRVGWRDLNAPSARNVPVRFLWDRIAASPGERRGSFFRLVGAGCGS